MKWLMFIVLIVCMCSSVLALDSCMEVVGVNESCTLITPALSCTVYYYNIYNSSGGNVSNGILSLYSGQNLYSLTFQEDIVDTYTVQVCDGSIVKIVVGNGDDDMLLGLLVFLPLVIAFGLLYWGNQLDVEHWFLKSLFQMLFIPLSLISLNFGVLSIATLYPSDSVMVNVLSDIAFYLGWVLVVVGVYILLWIILQFVKMTTDATKANNQEKYGDSDDS